MDFLDHIYFDNSVRSYLTVAGIILFVFLFKKILSKYLASLIFIPVNRIWKNLQKDHFCNLLVNPLSWFLTLLISVIALDKLNFPSILFYKIYGVSSQFLINKLGVGIIVFSFFWVVLRFIDFVSFILVNKNTVPEKRGHSQLIPFFTDLIKVIIGIVGTLIFISAVFNKNIGSLLTGLSIVGAALALSARESLENLIASFIIFFDKPFFIGDSVKMNTITGTVESIGLRSTTIRTPAKTLVTVPNKQMVDNPVDNISMLSNRRMEAILEFTTEAGLEDIISLKNDFQKIIDGKQHGKYSGSVFVNDYSKNGIKIIFELIAPPMPIRDFNTIKEDILLQLLKLVNESPLNMQATPNQFNIVPTTPEPVKRNDII